MKNGKVAHLNLADHLLTYQLLIKEDALLAAYIGTDQFNMELLTLRVLAAVA